MSWRLYSGDSGEIPLPMTAFGEISVAQPTSVTQVSATYGLLDNVMQIAALGASTSVDGNMFVAESGASTDGLAVINTTRQLNYKAGQGALVRLTALFENSSGGNDALAGLLTAENRLAFGYRNNEFGILHAHDGIAESQSLTITTPASGSENSTVTVNGVIYSVPITAGTVEHNAYEIAVYLELNDLLHKLESVGDTVFCTSLRDGPEPDFDFTSSTAVAAWSRDAEGFLIINEWTPQNLWNRDTMPNLDVTKGNVYQIQFQYLGFGAIRFYVEDSRTGIFVLVHVIEYANKNTTPSVSNPSFRIGWSSQNKGVAESVIIRGASAAAFNEGDPTQTDDTRGFDVDSGPIGLTETSILAIRNPYTFTSRINRVEVSLLLMSIATDSTKRAKFTIRKNPVITGDLVFSNLDDESPIQVAIDNSSVSGGKKMMSFVITKESSQVIDLTDKLLLLPTETLVISAEVSGGTTSEMAVSVSWREDF